MDAASSDPGSREAADLQAARDALPVQERQVLLLRLVLHLTMAETALAMRCSEQTARVLQARALRRLRDRLAGLAQG